MNQCISHSIDIFYILVLLYVIITSKQRPVDLAKSQDMRFMLSPTNIKLSKLHWNIMIIVANIIFLSLGLKLTSITPNLQ